IDSCEGKDLLLKLCYVSAEFPFFLIYAACSSKNDPFDIVLRRMIDEENNICFSENINHLSLRLIHDLRRIKSDYEIQINDSSLPDIY
ncbi:unnamed protein product, partial [Rotaria sp. Silwood2]